MKFQTERHVIFNYGFIEKSRCIIISSKLCIYMNTVIISLR